MDKFTMFIIQMIISTVPNGTTVSLWCNELWFSNNKMYYFNLWDLMCQRALNPKKSLLAFCCLAVLRQGWKYSDPKRYTSQALCIV